MVDFEAGRYCYSLETINITPDVINALKNIPFLIGQLIAEIIAIDALDVKEGAWCEFLAFGSIDSIFLLFSSFHGSKVCLTHLSRPLKHPVFVKSPNIQ